MLENIITISGRAFTHQSSTLSHTEIANSLSVESTPSTEAPSGDYSSGIWKSLSFTFLLTTSPCGFLRLSLPAQLLLPTSSSSFQHKQAFPLQHTHQKVSVRGNTQPTLSENENNNYNPGIISHSKQTNEKSVPRPTVSTNADARTTAYDDKEYQPGR